MNTFPTPQPDQGATNPPDPPEDATASGNDGSGDLSASPAWTAVQALATLLEPEAFDPNVKAAPEWRERAKGTALAYAAKVITSGYRLVSEDDTTVDRIGWALLPLLDDVREKRESKMESAERLARAAVRALREGGVA